jgi:AbrB family looped-hinge helix DNA binding protein
MLERRAPLVTDRGKVNSASGGGKAGQKLPYDWFLSRRLSPGLGDRAAADAGNLLRHKEKPAAGLVRFHVLQRRLDDEGARDILIQSEPLGFRRDEGIEHQTVRGSSPSVRKHGVVLPLNVLTNIDLRVKLSTSKTNFEVIPMAVVKISSKGQLVVPVEIRRKLGIKPGHKVNLTLVDGKAVITPLPEDPIKVLRGALKGKPSMTKALLDDRKKEIEREEKITSRLLRRSRLDTR